MKKLFLGCISLLLICNAMDSQAAIAHCPEPKSLSTGEIPAGWQKNQFSHPVQGAEYIEFTKAIIMALDITGLGVVCFYKIPADKYQMSDYDFSIIWLGNVKAPAPTDNNWLYGPGGNYLCTAEPHATTTAQCEFYK